MGALFSEAGKRTGTPFRFDIVGSFLRPREIKDARAKFQNGGITKAELKRVEDEQIGKLVEKEKGVGLKAVTDGEFRRSYWHLDFFWGLEGVEHVRMEHGYFFHGEETRPDSARLSGKIRFSGHPFLEHYEFMRKTAGDGVIARQAIPSPAQLYTELFRGENAKAVHAYYPDIDELAGDICEAYHKAILAFYGLGCRSLQMDDCTWGMLCGQSYREALEKNGQDLSGIQELYLRLNNGAIEGLPKDLTVTTHVCRGNFHSTWASSGGYGSVAQTLFGRENVSAYYLEYDTDRAGDFTPLRHISGNKLAVLGLFSSKTGVLEDRAQIIQRIKQASQYVAGERLCISPQCGFASTEEGNILTEGQQWDKLRFIKDIADEVWG